MSKTIWGKLCGPYGVCLMSGLVLSVLSFSILLSSTEACSVICLCVPVMLCSRDSGLPDLYFDEDTLICTLVGVCWLYFDEDTLIRTLVGVRWLYFDEDTLICTLVDEDTHICTFSIMHCSRDPIRALDESILSELEEGKSGF